LTLSAFGRCKRSTPLLNFRIDFRAVDRRIELKNTPIIERARFTINLVTFRLSEGTWDVDHVTPFAAGGPQGRDFLRHFIPSTVQVSVTLDCDGAVP
jgi:hypothetical protein